MTHITSWFQDVTWGHSSIPLALVYLVEKRMELRLKDFFLIEYYRVVPEKLILDKFLFCLFLCYFETGCHYVVLAGLEPTL